MPAGQENRQVTTAPFSLNGFIAAGSAAGFSGTLGDRDKDREAPAPIVVEVLEAYLSKGTVFLPDPGKLISECASGE